MVGLGVCSYVRKHSIAELALNQTFLDRGIKSKCYAIIVKLIFKAPICLHKQIMRGKLADKFFHNARNIDAIYVSQYSLWDLLPATERNAGFHHCQKGSIHLLRMGGGNPRPLVEIITLEWLCYEWSIYAVQERKSKVIRRGEKPRSFPTAHLESFYNGHCTWLLCNFSISYTDLNLYKILLLLLVYYLFPILCCFLLCFVRLWTVMVSYVQKYRMCLCVTRTQFSFFRKFMCYLWETCLRQAHVLWICPF